MSDEKTRKLPEVVSEVMNLMGRLNIRAEDVRALQYAKDRGRMLLRAIGQTLHKLLKLRQGMLDPILLEHPEFIPDPDPRRPPPPKLPKLE